MGAGQGYNDHCRSESGDRPAKQGGKSGLRRAGWPLSMVDLSSSAVDTPAAQDLEGTGARSRIRLGEGKGWGMVVYGRKSK
jgi:hypothetical protein